jgi:hypothetical protein
MESNVFEGIKSSVKPNSFDFLSPNPDVPLGKVLKSLKVTSLWKVIY